MKKHCSFPTQNLALVQIGNFLKPEKNPIAPKSKIMSCLLASHRHVSHIRVSLRYASGIATEYSPDGRRPVRTCYHEPSAKMTHGMRSGQWMQLTMKPIQECYTTHERLRAHERFHVTKVALHKHSPQFVPTPTMICLTFHYKQNKTKQNKTQDKRD